jgi:MoxR-like ATPase
LENSLIQYILDYIEVTRKHEDVELPLSPRASIAMVRAAKAAALLKGRDYVLPDDIKALAVPVFAHRLKLKKAEKYKGRQVEDFIRSLTEKVPLKLKV